MDTAAAAIHIISKYYGLKEVAGKANSPTIMAWIKKYFKLAKDDGAVAWCSIGLKEAFLELGCKFPQVTPMAISWAGVGLGIPLHLAKFGDVVILKRKGGHHVGLFVRYSVRYDKLFILGFNQKNRCSIDEYNPNLVISVRNLKNAI